MHLHEMASVLRSKNAGPWELTIDIMLDTEEHLRRVRAAPSLSRDRLAKLFEVPAEMFTFHYDEVALAMKISLPRPVSAGSFGDRDLFGCQFHSLLYFAEV